MFSTRATNFIRKAYGNNSVSVPDGNLQAITGTPPGTAFTSTSNELGLALGLKSGRDDAQWQAIVKIISPAIAQAQALILPKATTQPAATAPKAAAAAPVKKP
jgi:hypothetical protein